MKQHILASGLLMCLAAPSSAMTSGFALNLNGPVVGSGSASQMEAILSTKLSNQVEVEEAVEADPERNFLEWLALLLFGISEGDGSKRASNAAPGDVFAQGQGDVPSALFAETGGTQDDPTGQQPAPMETTLDATTAVCAMEGQESLCEQAQNGEASNTQLVQALLDAGIDRGAMLFFPEPTAVSPVEGNVGQIAPVPVPAAGLLLLASLGALGALRRRR